MNPPIFNLIRTGILCVVLLQVYPNTVVKAQVAEAMEQEVVSLFERSCTQVGCHAAPVPQLGLDLTEAQFYAGLVNEPSRGKPGEIRVVPGSPADSYLMKKLRGAPEIDGVQMPLAGSKLTASELGLVEQWISSLEEEDQDRKNEAEAPEIFPFYGWKMVNLPTNRRVAKGSVLFLIGHRFNPRIQDGYDAFFCLDGSGIIYLSLGYAFSDQLLVNLGRSNADDNVELNAKFNPIKQRAGGWPVSVGIQSSVNWFSEKRSGERRFRADVLKYATQLILTRAFTESFSLGFVPGVLVNPSVIDKSERPLYTLGVGGRWTFYRNFSLVAEWVPVVSGFIRTSTFGNANRFDSWGSAFEIAVGGHVFQIMVTNAVGLATDQYMRGGDLDILKGDVRLGFNIFRVLN